MTFVSYVRSTLAIATNTFREAIRNKIFGVLLLFAVVTIGASLVLGQMSLHHERRVTYDLSLFMSTIVSVIIAIYSMVTLLHTEIERRTIYTLLSKPIARWHFLLGKYVGVLVLMFVVVATLTLASILLVLMQGLDVSATYLWASATIYLQLAIIVGIALVFASFSTPLLSGMLTGLIFVVGNLQSQLDAVRKLFEDRGADAFVVVVDVAKFLLPNFEALNLAPLATHDQNIPWEYLLDALWYTVSYSAVLLLLAIGVFSRRDFA